MRGDLPGWNAKATFYGERTQGGKKVKLSVADVKVIIYANDAPATPGSPAATNRYTIHWPDGVEYAGGDGSTIRSADEVVIEGLNAGKAMALQAIELPLALLGGRAIHTGYLNPVVD